MLETMSENNHRRLNWSQILLTAVVTGVVTVITGVILGRLQAQEPSLIYSTLETIPFSGQEQVVGIYQVSISNDGNKEVEEVDAYVRVAGAKIEQRRISAAPTVAFSDEVNAEALRVHFPRINPAETIQISVLATAPTDLPKRSEVALRAKGIAGKEGNAGESKDFRSLTGVLAGLVGALAGVFSFFMRALGRSRRDVISVLSKREQDKHAADQRLVLAYLCDLHQLFNDAERYRTQVAEVSYWSESDRLATLAMNCNDKRTIENIKGVLEDLLKYARVAADSTGIILLNLARICCLASLPEEAQTYLTRAKTEGGELVLARLTLDPTLKSISGHEKRLSS